MCDFAAILDAWIRAPAEAAEAFLAKLVRVPSDNPPPGDCQPIAERAAAPHFTARQRICPPRKPIDKACQRPYKI